MLLSSTVTLPSLGCARPGTARRTTKKVTPTTDVPRRGCLKLVLMVDSFLECFRTPLALNAIACPLQNVEKAWVFHSIRAELSAKC
jgi:hypothetical protein